jgi:hypothetical protein
MGKMRYVCGLNVETDEVVLQFEENEKPLAHMTFFAADAEGLIQNLGSARAKLAEKVTPELEPGSRIAVMPNAPAWRITNTHGVQNTTLLALRHEGFGWVGFLLEPERALAIAKALMDFLPQPPKVE